MERYHELSAAAMVRGTALETGIPALPTELLTCPLEQLTSGDIAELIAAGQAAELKLYHFKQKGLLPRVRAVLGFLKGVQPESLLDVGSGRGVFLLPFLEEFPWVPVTSVDLLPHRVEMLRRMAAGGISHLTALQQDICRWDLSEGSFDTVTLLEVLEHIPDVSQAVTAAVRLARRYVVVTVPSKPDNNPEHIHLLTKDILTDLFTRVGCTRLSFSGVPGHLVLIAHVGKHDTTH